jgi:hypothetical protein
MTAVTSYATLLTAVMEEMDDTSIEDRIPGFIQRAEAMFNRRLYSLDAETTATASTVANTAYVSLPTGYKGMISVRIGDYEPLQYLSPDDFQRRWHESTAAVPENWSIINGLCYLGPTPDDVYTVNFNCFRTLTALSATNTSNWLLEKHPDVYFDATLAFAERDDRNMERWAVLTASVEKTIAEINAFDARKKRGNLIGTVKAEYF